MNTEFIIDILKTYGAAVLTILAVGAEIVWQWKMNHKSVITQDEKNSQALVKVTEVKVDLEAIKSENANLKAALKESIKSNEELKAELSDLKETLILRGITYEENEKI